MLQHELDLLTKAANTLGFEIFETKAIYFVNLLRMNTALVCESVAYLRIAPLAQVSLAGTGCRIQDANS